MIHRVLVGGTASGKKAVAAELWRRHGWRPLSMDSMKVYRGMDVGTDKPPPELVAATGWALLDLVGHDEPFSAGRWIEAARREVEATDGEVLFAGGTPLYLRLLTRGVFTGPPVDPVLRAALDEAWARRGGDALRAELAAVDPAAAARLAPGDRKRILRALEVYRLTGRPLTAWQEATTRPPLPGRFRLVALRHEPRHHARRIGERVDRMLVDGLLDEVAALSAAAPFASEPARAIGYAEALAVLAGRLDREAARERIVTRTRRLVRKQRTFLRSFDELVWVDLEPGDSVARAADRVEAALAAAGEPGDRSGPSAPRIGC